MERNFQTYDGLLFISRDIKARRYENWERGEEEEEATVLSTIPTPYSTTGTMYCMYEYEYVVVSHLRRKKERSCSSFGARLLFPGCGSICMTVAECTGTAQRQWKRNQVMQVRVVRVESLLKIYLTCFLDNIVRILSNERYLSVGQFKSQIFFLADLKQSFIRRLHNT